MKNVPKGVFTIDKKKFLDYNDSVNKVKGAELCRIFGKEERNRKK